MKGGGLALYNLIQPTISLEMPVPSQGHYVFTVFRLLTDFVCLYTYEFWLSLCYIVRSSVILLPLFKKVSLITLEHTFSIHSKSYSNFMFWDLNINSFSLMLLCDTYLVDWLLFTANISNISAIFVTEVGLQKHKINFNGHSYETVLWSACTLYFYV
jgi:hypothetical protein